MTFGGSFGIITWNDFLNSGIVQAALKQLFSAVVNLAMSAVKTDSSIAIAG